MLWEFLKTKSMIKWTKVNLRLKTSIYDYTALPRVKYPLALREKSNIIYFF